MALVQYLLDAGPEGAALSNANSGSVASSTAGGSATTFATAKKATGAGFGMKAATIAASGNAYRRWLFADSVEANNWASSFVLTMPPSPPPASHAVFHATNGTDQRILGLILGADGSLGAQDSDAGFGTIVSGLTWGAKYRISTVVTGGSTTAGAVQIKVYSGTTDWVAQFGPTFSRSNWNLRATPASRFNLGVVTGSASTPSVEIGIDDIQLDDGRTTEIPDIGTAPTPLPTPANVTATTAPPSTSGGNGSVTLEWDRVTAAAGGYRVEIAPGWGATTGFVSRGVVAQSGSSRISTVLTDLPGQYTYRIYALP